MVSPPCLAIMQIADIGMSRAMQDTDYYVSREWKISVKWTAPEALHYKEYSTASDVWSFGSPCQTHWYKWKNHFSEMKWDVGMSLYEKEWEQEDS